jgi:hypothetical protein
MTPKIVAYLPNFIDWIYNVEIISLNKMNNTWGDFVMLGPF